MFAKITLFIKVGCLALLFIPNVSKCNAILKYETLNSIDRKLIDEVFRMEPDLQFRSFPNVPEDNAVKVRAATKENEQKEVSMTVKESAKDVKKNMAEEDNKMKRINAVPPATTDILKPIISQKPDEKLRTDWPVKFTSPKYREITIIPPRELPPHSYDTYSNYRSALYRPWFATNYMQFGWRPPLFFDQYKRTAY